MVSGLSLSLTPWVVLGWPQHDVVFVPSGGECSKLVTYTLILGPKPHSRGSVRRTQWNFCNGFIGINHSSGICL